jgi:outer membrane protein assembly factor BamE (lipoprotein component of BamABCDE complex)
MRLLVLKLAAILMFVFLASCAGTNFVRVADDSLVLGQTTQTQIRSKLGNPYREGTVTKNDQQLKTLSYAYSTAGGSPDAEHVTPARSQGFYFREDILVGYEFTSSYKQDSTGFDGQKVAQIKKGVSTRSDVLRIMGNPGGQYMYPLIKNPKEKGINYLHHQTKGSAYNLKFYQKTLVVTFNAQDIVSDVEYTESGQ